MEIILSKQCESLTGSLGRGFGYHIQRRKNGFFAKRNTKGEVPRDGHLRFIFACANLAQSKLHITDIRVHSEELMYALWKAGRETLGDYIFTEPDKFPETFHADDIMKFKNEYSL